MEGSEGDGGGGNEKGEGMAGGGGGERGGEQAEAKAKAEAEAMAQPKVNKLQKMENPNTFKAEFLPHLRNFWHAFKEPAWGEALCLLVVHALSGC